MSVDDALAKRREASRLRRKQNNKEAAQRSRQRKKEQLDNLTAMVKQLSKENEALRARVLQLEADGVNHECSCNKLGFPAQPDVTFDKSAALVPSPLQSGTLRLAWPVYSPISQMATQVV